MKKYEKEFRLRSLYLAIIRRFDIIAICFLPLFLVSLIFTQIVMKKTYVSDITVSKSTIITNEQYQNIQTTALKYDVLKKTLSGLDEKNIKHSNGNPITLSEVTSGLKFPAYQSNSISASFSFSSTDKTITKSVLYEVTTNVVEELKGRSAYSDLSVSKSASDPHLDGKNMKYFLIASAASLVVAYAVAVIFEISADEVYDAGDVERFGVTGFEIKLKKNKSREEK